MKKMLIGILSLASAMCAMAQEQPRVLTLDECRIMAAQNNSGVKIAAGNAQAARQTSQEAFTKYFPEVSAQGLAFRSNKDVFRYDVADLFTLGLIKKGTAANITAVQPVFAGGRIANGNKLAKVGEKAAQLELDNALDNALVTAEQYYWQIVTLKSKKSTLESVIQMVDTLQRQVSVAVDAGVVMRNDLLKVQLKLNDLRALMVDLDNGIDLASNLLAQYVGLDGQPIDVADVGAPDVVPPYPSDLFVDAQSALPGTNDYQLLQQQVKAADLEKAMALGQNLPTVGIGGGFFYDDLLNQNHGFWAGFISVSVPISGWWGGAHSLKKKSIAAANARLQLDDLSQMLQIKMQDAWDNLTAAYRKMEIARESIDQSKENLRLNQNYYKAGVSTITDLLEAQTLYRQAMDQYAESYGAFRLCQVQYIDATGRTQAP